MKLENDMDIQPNYRSIRRLVQDWPDLMECKAIGNNKNDETLEPNIKK